MNGALLLHPLPYAGLDQEVYGALLQDAGTDLRLQRLAAAALEHYRVDPLEVQEVREQEPRRTTPDYPYLCAHHPSPSFRK
jgi:hypothetical protein